MNRRPTWDDYFLGVMDTVAARSTCDRGRSGCVIVKEKRVLCTGYVGSPVGAAHCDDVGHEFEETIHEGGAVTKHCVRTVHAEQNAICQAARHGVAINGATLYCRMTPCRVCAMMIINSGIVRVVCEKKYHNAAASLRMFKDAGVEIFHRSGEVQKYEK